MNVKVTKAFSSVRLESDLHPRLYAVGDVATDYAAAVALRNGWGESIADEPPPQAAAPAPPALKARLVAPYDGPDHTGAPVRIAEGAIVEDELAAFLIDQGVALPVADGKQPPPNKAKGAAPKTK